MSDFGPPYGFALRRNRACLENEVSSGETWSDIYPCCPKGTTFGNSSVCCPDKKDCMEDVMNPPHCADESWDLFNNTRDDGFFCCLSGTKGFYHSDKQAVGCIDDSDAPTNTKYRFLSTYSTGKIHILLTRNESSSDITRRCRNIDYSLDSCIHHSHSYIRTGTRWSSEPFYFKYGRYRRWCSWRRCWVSNHYRLALVFHASPITEASISRRNTYHKRASDTIPPCPVFRHTQRVARSKLCGRAGQFWSANRSRVTGISNGSWKGLTCIFLYPFIKP